MQPFCARMPSSERTEHRNKPLQRTIPVFPRKKALPHWNFSSTDRFTTLVGLRREAHLNTSDRFLRFANECEYMAHLSPTSVNKVVWRDLAHRWRRCAELSPGDDTTAYIDRLRRRQFKAAHPQPY
jgi:hypothetical protein